MLFLAILQSPGLAEPAFFIALILFIVAAVMTVARNNAVRPYADLVIAVGLAFVALGALALS